MRDAQSVVVSISIDSHLRRLYVLAGLRTQMFSPITSMKLFAIDISGSTWKLMGSQDFPSDITEIFALPQQ